MSRIRLTRRAALDLQDIHDYSAARWGPRRAADYLSKLYAALRAIAASKKSRPRARRATPFFMLSAGRHFIVYERAGKEIIVLTVLHQRRDIESIVAGLGSAFFAEIAEIKGPKA